MHSLNENGSILLWKHIYNLIEIQWNFQITIIQSFRINTKTHTKKKATQNNNLAQEY